MISLVKGASLLAILSVVHAASDHHHGRLLEAMDNGTQILEQGLGQSMIINADILQQQYPKSEIHPSPWPSSYWATCNDSINYQWDGANPSPAEKYAKAFGLNVQEFMNNVSLSFGVDSVYWLQNCTSQVECEHATSPASVWAKRRGQSKGKCIPFWFGITSGWTTAAIFEPEPSCEVVVNGVTFKPLDIKGLLTAFYEEASLNSKFIMVGKRYNTRADPVDKYGRYTAPDERDMNPGIFHIAFANLLGKLRRSFVADLDPTAAVANFPMRSYEVKKFQKMKPAEAAKKYFNVSAYPFNNNAVDVAYVQNVVRVVNETNDDGPFVSTGRLDAVTWVRTYEYLLELDGKGNIIGGEWLFESKLDHFDFAWLIKDKPKAEVVDSGIRYRDLAQLLTASVSCTTQYK